jgi:hypothetical protein
MTPTERAQALEQALERLTLKKVRQYRLDGYPHLADAVWGFWCDTVRCVIQGQPLAFDPPPSGASPQVEVRQCDAIHLTTGAACELPIDHLENHRGAFRHGVMQWTYESAPVSPVEPEPPLAALNELVAEAQELGIYLPDQPTVEPEPCVWRVGRSTEYDTGCGEYFHGGTDRMRLCPYCGAPLKVEKP